MVAPGEEISGLEDEYQLAHAKPKLMYLKTRAPAREPRLTALLDRIRSDDRVSYRAFRTPAELRRLVADDLALLLTERFTSNQPVASPPLASRRNNLPAELSSFIGREREVQLVRALVSANRLVTLTGPGGAGKTRLARRSATESIEEFPDGVYFVDLAPLGEADLVEGAVATALGLLADRGRPVLTVLLDVLHDQRVLIVLDNCEHLLSACAELAVTLLRSCPRVHVLATSREPLSTVGEVAWPVPPLAAPNSDTPLSLEQLRLVEAVQLFVPRAAAAQPAFDVTAQNANSVAEVCQKLEGIPLAIELAAARVRSLSVQQIAARLDDRFRLLTGGDRTSTPRQQTLRGALDWSHDLLSAGRAGGVPSARGFRGQLVARGGGSSLPRRRHSAVGGVRFASALN